MRFVLLPKETILKLFSLHITIGTLAWASPDLGQAGQLCFNHIMEGLLMQTRNSRKLLQLNVKIMVHMHCVKVLFLGTKKGNA